MQDSIIRRVKKRIYEMIDKNKSTPEPEMENKNFPPELSRLNIVILTACYVLGISGAIIAIIELCFRTQILIGTTCLSYVGIGFVLTGIIVDRLIRYKTRLHKSRSEDQSVVESIIIEASTIDSKTSSPGIKPEDFEEKKNQLSEEISRLNKLIIQDCCTEYQILPIQKMLVDFMSNDELKTRAKSTLAELQDYAEDSSYRYDIEYYINWEQRIDKAQNLIPEDENNPENDSGEDNSSYLRSELKDLIGHVTDYTYSWTLGSEQIRSLIVCSAAAIPLLIVSGLIPVIHPSDAKSMEFGFLSWGLLGTSGSLTAVLSGLRGSNYVEVGNTEGKKELWRAIIGSVLGFVSGILVYSLLGGGLIETGTAVPNLASDEIRDVGLMVVWAFLAGFSFEKIFDRFRTFNAVNSSS